MELININEQLIDLTSKFASEVFVDYYNDLIGNKQATYMADLFLSNNAIKKLIDDGAVFKLMMLDDKPIGFTEYVKEDNRVFLSKLYIHKDYRHLGYGKQLFLDCYKYAKDNNLEAIYLTVNKYNTPSYNIYLHLGFKVIDSVVNDIGNNYVMDDYIMQLNISDYNE